MTWLRAAKRRRPGPGSPERTRVDGNLVQADPGGVHPEREGSGKAGFAGFATGCRCLSAPWYGVSRVTRILSAEWAEARAHKHCTPLSAPATSISAVLVLHKRCDKGSGMQRIRAQTADVTMHSGHRTTSQGPCLPAERRPADWALHALCAPLRLTPGNRPPAQTNSEDRIRTRSRGPNSRSFARLSSPPPGPCPTPGESTRRARQDGLPGNSGLQPSGGSDPARHESPVP